MSQSAGMRIGSYDPSISKGGICVLARPEPQRFELVHHRKVGTNSKQSLIERIDVIRRNIVEVCRDYHPTHFVVENQDRVLVGAQMRGKRNFNTSKQIAAYTTAVVAAQCMGVHVIGCEPQAAKIALLGPRNGHAEKKQVQDFMQRMFGIELSEDEADAGALCVYGFQEMLRRTKAA